ncbi:magnesium transporter MgtE N-terminal domain-containing protein [Alkalicoccus daliensis]|uniref:Flagellar motility protein MotE, a chaperone for MotC folding n=1 Tax=Alkalicoccus daliensis TaxID=745820 RepID=A0A1H0A4D8_9BACI|nr:hypothetical protein [Alkalicoccus daliensis]SDN28091.1 Flagellar motility protein MotE, a chaperone for MotC folding [Alkalicoccus daliensis]
MTKQKEKTQNKFQIIFMIVIIPLVFALILAVVMLYYLGFNVGDTVRDLASNLPFVESEQEDEIDEEEYLAQLEFENESYAQRIQELERELEAATSELAGIEEELSAVENEEEEDGEEADQALADFNDVVRTLSEMTASRAASIIEELPEEQAVLYLRGMNVNTRAEILSRVDAELAASILNQISN